MIDIIDRYRPPRQEWWSGRSDGPESPRYHEIVSPLNLLNNSLPKQKAVALVGFAVDEGISRNQGRPGARGGPEAFRSFFGNLPVYLDNNTLLLDVGDITCPDENLEASQKALASIVRTLLENNIFPIVIGGGHELAFGQYQGLDPNTPYSIINFDAHYDVRPLLKEGKGHSGSSFLQIANQCAAHHVPFNYTCIGVQRLSNTLSLAKTASSLNVSTVFAETVIDNPALVAKAIDSAPYPIYLSICLDVFGASYAPGVSAPQPLGLNPHDILPHIQKLGKSGKVITLGIAELSPPYDEDGATARLAALLVASFLA